jgi:stearoyl-CoA desaturase (Delta-9 desaturase)
MTQTSPTALSALTIISPSIDASALPESERLVADTPALGGAEIARERRDSRIPVSRAVQIANIVGVFLPLAGVLAAIVLLWGVAFDWVHLVIMGVMYLLTGLGITVGFHRYFTHKSFDAPKPVEIALGILGSMAVQGPLLQWAATHRRHHQHSDEHDDPHSPHAHDHEGVLGVIKGAWHAHMGWMIESRRHPIGKYIPDLRSQPTTRMISKLFPLWALLGLVLPGIVAGLITWSWLGVLLGVIWGGLVRTFLVHHVTWSVNSICHIWGSRPYNSHDESRNNPIVGVLALGEGWHNNHHAFPASARHGLAWWQVDISYEVIRLMGLVGLVRNIRVPTKDRCEAKRRES